MARRFDIIFYSDSKDIGIQEHFCREYVCDDTHGLTWEEAKEEVASYFENKAKHYLEKSKSFKLITEREYFNE